MAQGQPGEITNFIIICFTQGYDIDFQRQKANFFGFMNSIQNIVEHVATSNFKIPVPAESVHTHINPMQPGLF